MLLGWLYLLWMVGVVFLPETEMSHSEATYLPLRKIALIRWKKLLFKIGEMEIFEYWNQSDLILTLSYVVFFLSLFNASLQCLTIYKTLKCVVKTLRTRDGCSFNWSITSWNLFIFTRITSFVIDCRCVFFCCNGSQDKILSSIRVPLPWSFSPSIDCVFGVTERNNCPSQARWKIQIQKKTPGKAAVSWLYFPLCLSPSSLHLRLMLSLL